MSCIVSEVIQEMEVSIDRSKRMFPEMAKRANRSSIFGKMLPHGAKCCRILRNSACYPVAVVEITGV